MSKKSTRPKKTPPPPVASWTCPKCGATHPVTVTTCCPGTFDPPTFPVPTNPWHPWDLGTYPRITCASWSDSGGWRHI